MAVRDIYSAYEINKQALKFKDPVPFKLTELLSGCHASDSKIFIESYENSSFS